jgi:hypothetical protein
MLEVYGSISPVLPRPGERTVRTDAETRSMALLRGYLERRRIRRLLTALSDVTRR